MGSFATTCAVSGLPIQYEDPVRILMLTRSRFRERPCYMTDIWCPRVWPLHATYNDYGSVENVETGATRQSWLDGFQRDLVERGWGPNSCHDVPVGTDMSFEQLLEALWEHRVLVHSYGRPSGRGPSGVIHEPSDDTRREPPDGVPTMARVAQIAGDCGLEIFDSRFGHRAPNVVMIDDDDGLGRVRVRPVAFSGSTDALRVLDTALRSEGYACMITRSTDGPGPSCELIVRPGPDATDYWFHPSPIGTERVSPVRQAMIREDVWQALVEIRVEAGYERVVSIDDRRRQARAAWHRMASSTGLEDPVSVGLGLGTSFRLVRNRREEMTADEIEGFLDTVAEYIHISDVLAVTRYTWRPSYPCGPQFGEWQTHEQVLGTFSEIARANRLKDE